MKHKAHRLWSVLFLLLGATLFFASGAPPALAAQVQRGNAITVDPNQTIDDDLYAFGGTITIDGTVNGDVYAFGGTVIVRGSVTGDLTALGGTVSVSGSVGGTLRAAGGTITIDGQIGRNVLVAAGTTTIDVNARVGRDLLAGAGSVILLGRVGRDVRAGGGSVQLGSGAVVAGNLVYSGNRKADIAAGATVRGTVERQQVAGVGFPGIWPAGAFGSAGDLVVGWLRTFFGLAVLGLLFIRAAPRFGRRTSRTLGGSPWASLGLGVALLICVPIGAVILFALGLFAGGWWLALFVLALFAIALSLGLPVAALTLSRWIMGRVGGGNWPLGWALLAGLTILLLVGLIPYAGALLVFVAMLSGLGSLVLTATGPADDTADEVRTPRRLL